MSRLPFPMPMPIDSAAWTGRYPKPAKPQPAPDPQRETFADDLARLADEYGTDFASRVAGSYNAIWRS